MTRDTKSTYINRSHQKQPVIDRCWSKVIKFPFGMVPASDARCLVPAAENIETVLTHRQWAGLIIFLNLAVEPTRGHK
jgi:hypothetical protein